MMKKIGKYTILLCIAIFGLHSICFICNGLKRPTKYADIAIILGNKVNEDGTLSVRLQKRCDEGVDLYNDKLVNKLIVSGGLGKEGFYEGDKMRDYLISKGIPDSVIIVDNLGNNTEQSMKNLSTLQEKEKFERVIVVSQYYHITRAKQLLKKYGFKNIEGASPLYFEWRDIYSLPREIIAYDINLLK